MKCIGNWLSTRSCSQQTVAVAQMNSLDARFTDLRPEDVCPESVAHFFFIAVLLLALKDLLQLQRLNESSAARVPDPSLLEAYRRETCSILATA
jgi:hypothetical protein